MTTSAFKHCSGCANSSPTIAIVCRSLFFEPWSASSNPRTTRSRALVSSACARSVFERLSSLHRSAHSALCSHASSIRCSSVTPPTPHPPPPTALNSLLTSSGSQDALVMVVSFVLNQQDTRTLVRSRDVLLALNPLLDVIPVNPPRTSDPAELEKFEFERQNFPTRGNASVSFVVAALKSWSGLVLLRFLFPISRF